jgi:hypothetical protein
MVAAIFARRHTAPRVSLYVSGVSVMKIWMTTTSVVVALASAAPAMAGDNNGFGVGTSASTGQYLDTYGGVASSTSAYRMGQDSSGNYTRMGDVAPVSFAARPDPALIRRSARATRAWFLTADTVHGLLAHRPMRTCPQAKSAQAAAPTIIRPLSRLLVSSIHSILMSGAPMPRQ